MEYFIDKELQKSRIIFLDTQINDESASRVIKQLLFFASQNNNPIYLYINSSGGSVSSGIAIYDTMQHIKAQVITIGFGMCASMGAFLLSSGEQRYCLPNCEILLHQPSVDCLGGQISQIEIEFKHLQRLKEKMTSILAQNCKQSYRMMERVLDRDTFFNPHGAKKFGIIDEVLL